MTIVVHFARNETRKSPLESSDPSFISASNRVSSAIRRSSACVMALSLFCNAMLSSFISIPSNFPEEFERKKYSGNRQH